ncbi:MAG: CapA family protein [Lachnospiraceae bacterium]|nr:CapA family protein [Lachnospiraceae bacterium]
MHTNTVSMNSTDNFRNQISTALVFALFIFTVAGFTPVHSASCGSIFSTVPAHAADIAPRYMEGPDGIYREAFYSSGNILRYKEELLDLIAVANGSSSVTLMFTGDLMCLKGQQYAALDGKKYDFTTSYQYVKKIFDEADLCVGNLESLISSSYPLTKDQVNAANGSPQCNGPVAYLRDLRRAGFDVLVTANNHCCDWGADGINETIDMLDRYRFCHTGTRKSDEDVPNYRIISVRGITVGIISTTHLVNQRGSLTSDEMSQMVNCYSEKSVASQIKAARKAGAEFIVVYAHWGIENTHDLVDYQKKDAAAIAEAGADLIIGSHPHCLQHSEELSTTDGRTVPVIYSMGNFVSSMAREINNDTIILKVKLKRVQGKAHIESCTYIPCHVLSSGFVITPVSFADADVCSAFQAKKPLIIPGKNQFTPSSSQAQALAAAGKRIRAIFTDMKEETALFTAVSP